MGFFPIPAESTFSAPELAAATGISTATVEHVLTAFCYGAAEDDAGRAVEQAVRGPSPFRAAPILCDGDRYFMTHCSFGLHVVREAVESRLRGTPDWQPYQKWRGSFLELETQRTPRPRDRHNHQPPLTCPTARQNPHHATRIPLIADRDFR